MPARKPWVSFDFVLVKPAEGYKPPCYQIYGVAADGTRTKLQKLYLKDEAYALIARLCEEIDRLKAQ